MSVVAGSDLLVLWDVDGTLLNAGGVGVELYGLVFRGLFGRAPDAFAPMAGRTDRAIIRETLELAGVASPREWVDPFIAGLTAHARRMPCPAVPAGCTSRCSPATSARSPRSSSPRSGWTAR